MVEKLQPEGIVNQPVGIGRKWLSSSELGLLVAIAVVIVIAGLADRNHTYFYKPTQSGVDIIRQVALLGIFSLGAAIVIISGGIDLSSGSLIAFSGTICATCLVFLDPDTMDPAKAGGDVALSTGTIGAAILVTLLVGVLVGSLHAWLITVVGLPPFVATLATLVGLRSLARAICQTATETYIGGRNTQIQVSDVGFRYLATSVWIPVVIFLVLSLLVWILLSKTVIGRHIYAIGGNEEAARLSGIRVNLVKWLCYCIAAVTSSIAGVLYIAEVAVADPQTLAVGYELNAIAAAVVGGCSLQGGIGTVTGTMLGVIFLRCVIDGVAKIIKTGADVYEGLIVGIVVVVAVAFSQLGRKSGAKPAAFPGALGIVAIITLSLLALAIATVMVGKTAGYIAGLVALVALGGWKIMQTARRQPKPA